jgi:hypothetical protein
MSNRLDQIAEIKSQHDRYEGYYQVIHLAALAPNFTEYGFGLAKCPDDLLHALQMAIHEGSPDARYEAKDAWTQSTVVYFSTGPDGTCLA